MVGNKLERAFLLRLPHATVTCLALCCYPAWQERGLWLTKPVQMRILLGSRRGHLKFHKMYVCASTEGSGVITFIQA